MMVRGYRTFHEFEQAGEGIATNILADRLRKLEAAEILITEPAAKDGRSTHYRLTAKGIALAPVLLDLLIWAAHHEPTAAPDAAIAQMEQNREAILAETYRRWQQRDPTPLIPPFAPLATVRNSKKSTQKNLPRKENRHDEAECLRKLCRELQRSAAIL